MPISNLVECAVNLAEKVTGKDIDGDGDVGVAGEVSAKRQLDDAKEKTNLNAKMSEEQLDGNANRNASTFPVFDPATPKVSTLSIGMGVLESAIELVNEAEQQTRKFRPKASEKAGFMLTNYELPNPNPGMVTKCTLANATGVRLEFIEAGSTGLVQEYKPPMILEPGEVASFLVDKSTFELKYNIQTFQGPIPFGPAGQAGWVRGEADKTVTVQGKDLFQTSIDAVVQVDQTTMYPTQLKFAVSRNGDAWQISATQSITGYSLTGKAAVLGSGDSILLGRTGDLGFAGGESWTIEVWVKVDEVRTGETKVGDEVVDAESIRGPFAGVQAVFGTSPDQAVFGASPDEFKLSYVTRIELSFNLLSAGKPLLSLANVGGFANVGDACDPTPIGVNVWTHFALQFEKAPLLATSPTLDPAANAAGDLRIFRNGVLVAANRALPLEGNLELRLGKYESVFVATSLFGSVAQVRLWNVAVPASEIKARLYMPGPSLATPGLREVLEFGKLAPTDPRIEGIKLEDFEVAPPAP